MQSLGHVLQTPRLPTGKGSQETLVSCASLGTFCAHRKYPAGGRTNRFLHQSPAETHCTHSPAYPIAAESIRPAAVTCSTARRNSSERVLRSMPTMPTVQRTAPSTP